MSKVPNKDGDSNEEIRSLGKTEENKLYERKFASFFSADSEEIDPINKVNESFNELANNATNFSFARFLEFAIYHLIFFFFLGPFTTLFFLLLKRNTILARNLAFWGHSKYFYMQTMIFILNFIGIFGYFYFVPWQMNKIEVLGLIGSTVIRSFVIAVKYAYFTERHLFLIRNKVLTKEEKEYHLLVNWAEQPDEVIRKEVKETIIRNYVDTALFKFRFFKPLKESLLIEIFDEKTKADAEKKLYCGEEIANYLIKSVRRKKAFPSWIVCLVLSLIRAMIPVIYRIITCNFMLGDNFIESFVMMSVFKANIYFFMVNYLFIFNGIFEYDRQGKLLANLSNLISVETVEKYKIKKEFTTINFACNTTLTSWHSLNRIFRDYGRRFYNRIDIHLGIFLVYYIIITTVCVLIIYNIINYNNLLILILFGYEIAVVFLGLLFLIWKGVVINDHFEIHRKLLNNSKDIISKFYLQADSYIYDEKYVSENEVYVFIKECLLELFQREKFNKEEGDKYLEKLLDLNEFVQTQLKYDEEKMPFKVLGQTADKAFFQKIIAGLMSLATAVFNKLYGSDDE